MQAFMALRFESFKANLDTHAVHWSTRRHQVEPHGLTPEEFQSQPITRQSF